MRELDAGEEGGGEAQATSAQMREVGTGAARWLAEKGKSEGIWWIDGKWQWMGLGNSERGWKGGSERQTVRAIVALCKTLKDWFRSMCTVAEGKANLHLMPRMKLKSEYKHSIGLSLNSHCEDPTELWIVALKYSTLSWGLWKFS